MALKGQGITVAGGGVAGLAAARALALRGADVRLCEKAPEITEVGAGLQISPNGIRVADALGLGVALRDVSLEAERVVLRDGEAAREVLTLDLARGRGDYLLVHRARLIEVLLAGVKAAGVSIFLDARIAPADATGTVVAADGLHSRHRAALNGDGSAAFTGQAAWRAVIEEDPAAAREVQVFMGPGRHLVSYPLKGGLRNIVAVEERAEWVAEGWAHEDAPEAVRAAFAGFGGPVRDWLDRVTNVHLWGLYRHPVAQTWSDGRIFLAGDAAHPTLPFLAQGANMALEDALILARVLDGHPLSAAGPIYQAARRRRTERIVAAATANARNYHLSGASKVLAHTALRTLSVLAPAQALRRFVWLYDYDAGTVRLSGA